MTYSANVRRSMFYSFKEILSIVTSFFLFLVPLFLIFCLYLKDFFGTSFYYILIVMQGFLDTCFFDILFVFLDSSSTSLFDIFFCFVGFPGTLLFDILFQSLVFHSIYVFYIPAAPQDFPEILLSDM